MPMPTIVEEKCCANRSSLGPEASVSVCVHPPVRSKARMDLTVVAQAAGRNGRVGFQLFACEAESLLGGGYPGSGLDCQEEI